MTFLLFVFFSCGKRLPVAEASSSVHIYNIDRWKYFCACVCVCVKVHRPQQRGQQRPPTWQGASDTLTAATEAARYLLAIPAKHRGDLSLLLQAASVGVNRPIRPPVSWVTSSLTLRRRQRCETVPDRVRSCVSEGLWNRAARGQSTLLGRTGRTPSAAARGRRGMSG